ncbi:DUF2631 domain-containing protein [Glycomyces buryatensis]|uniref:DUF2631 domain-containing protein n=1 Tax=Glycomyces buryatensis TaxID=2570927 RepID=A0A4S8QFW0_9ACTN|nr:DUF2631 domain-containing protein [Glycomyces buryatensis]THV43260.1 DUF2631 domain-containing protein [Glycomyces buryatensis]
MSAEEQILSPDQRKPTSRKGLYSALLIGAAVLLSFLFGNHLGYVEDVFIGTTAAVLIGIVVFDAWLRRTGLR